VISSPFTTIMHMIHKIVGALTGAGGKKGDYLDLMKLLYELFVLGRRNGLIALEDHVLDPNKSPIFQKYPSFLKSEARVRFLCNGLKPLIDGRIKPEQIEGLLHSEVAAKEEEADAPVHILQLIGDSLPGVGIIAAVLGIINTMAAIADGPEAVGERVAAALTGTFLGILGAYGFVNPLTSRIKVNNNVELQYYASILKGISGFANGMAPIMAVELSRRCLDGSVQPDADELEAILKALNTRSDK
jgi:chemotaxis protein MotA